MALGLADAMDDVFLDCGFEENIVYTQSGGTETTIKAVVDRGGTSQIRRFMRNGQVQDTRRFDIEISISTTDVPSVTENADKVKLTARIGDALPRTYIVRAVISNDEGAWHLGLG